jgi:hypothetical protein
MTDLTDVLPNYLITSARTNLINEYIEHGTHKINTLSVDIGGTETITSSRAGVFTGLSIGSLSGLLKASSGVVSTAILGTDYIKDLSGFTTDNLTEGSNLYYTEARVSANTDVSANTSSRHDAVSVTDSSEIDFTLTGQDITATIKSGSIDESKLDTSVNASLDLADSAVQDVVTSLGYTPEDSANKGQNNGYASLDAGGKIPASELPSTVMDFKGNWDADTNTPTLVDGTGDAGDVYLVSVAGTQDLGSGSITFAEGDWVLYNGTIWQKSINSNAVVSVNTQTGVVTLDTSHIAENANLYFTTQRARDSVSAGTGISYNSTTGVITNDGVVTETDPVFNAWLLATPPLYPGGWYDTVQNTIVLSGFNDDLTYEVPLTFSTGLTRTTNTITVDTSQNISQLTNLSTDGFIKTTGTNGTLTIDTNTYLTGITGQSISDLSDVDSIAGIVDGKILKWDTNKFVVADDENTTYTSSDFNLEDLGDVVKTDKAEGKILKVDSDGNHVYVTDESGTDEKVKYNSEDSTAGFVVDKIIAGSGISVAEGTGADENKLVITNSDKGSDIDLSGLVPYTGATGDVDLGTNDLFVNGKVGIGTTSLIGKLTVEGSRQNPSLRATESSLVSLQNDLTRLAVTITGDVPFTASLQHKHYSIDGFSYPIALNPRGGNVGIGTDSPVARLDLGESVDYAETPIRSIGSYQLRLGADPNSTGRISTGIGVLPDGATSVAAAINPYDDGGSHATGWSISTGDGGSLTERMRIKANGNVGIGTTNPTEKLEIDGNLFLNGDNDKIYLGADKDEYLEYDPTLDGIQTAGKFKASEVRAVHKASDGTAPVADGTYVMGIGAVTNGTITIKDGIITTVQEASDV